MSSFDMSFNDILNPLTGHCQPKNNFSNFPGDSKIACSTGASVRSAKVRPERSSRRNTRDFLGPALVAGSLRPGQEQRTMHTPEAQIGNSGSKKEAS